MANISVNLRKYLLGLDENQGVSRLSDDLSAAADQVYEDVSPIYDDIYAGSGDSYDSTEADAVDAAAGDGASADDTGDAGSADGATDGAGSGDAADAGTGDDPGTEIPGEGGDPLAGLPSAYIPETDVPGWFDEEYYGQQKVIQMRAISWNDTSEWADGSFPQALAQYNEANETNITAIENFEACNTFDYADGITAADINVAPNIFFDVPVYLQNVANFANATGYEAEGYEAGAWTVETVLEHMFNDGRMSAWEHYRTQGIASGINPSNLFDTAQYLEDRAQAMNIYENSDGSIGWNGRTDWTVEDVANEMLAAGNNPIMDYCLVGVPILNMEVPPTAPETQTVVDVPEGWTQWGLVSPDPVSPDSPVDPYEQITETIAVTQEQTDYQGTDGENTLFEARHLSSAAASTLSPDDVFNGGEGYNTLSVELGANWTGFNGASMENEDGDSVLGPNVMNVGRIKIVHTEDNTESTYTFDASNISDDAVRYDVNNEGFGLIHLKNLSAAVEEVNISGIQPKAEAVTSIGFAEGAVDGEDDALTLGVKNIGSQTAAAGIAVSGIETLTINGLEGQNYVSLAKSTGIEAVKVKGSADVTITDVPARGIASFDASEATGSVNMAVGSLKAETVITGGDGFDTITLTSPSTTLAPAKWTGVEALWVGGGASATIDATNVTGLQQLQVWGPSAKISNVTANDFAIYENATTVQTIAANGEITNLSFTTAAEDETTPVMTTKVSSNVKQNVDITIDGKANFAGSFNFNGGLDAEGAKGDVNLTVGENATIGGSINAFDAKSFTADIQGAIADGTAFNVVNGSGGSVSITSENGVTTNATGLKLNANGATTVDFNVNGSMKLTGSLKAAQDINISLESEEDSGSVFDMSAINLKSAQDVDIVANGEQVKIGALGDAQGNGGITLDVNGVQGFEAKTITTSTGWSIEANIDSLGGVTLDNITAAGGGNVDITVNTGGAELAGGTAGALADVGGDGFSISGSNLSIDFSGVQGTVFAGQTNALTARGTITYDGNSSGEHILINAIGSGKSVISLEGGADSLIFGSAANTDYGIGSGQRARVVVGLGSDANADTLTVNNAAAGKGTLIITVEDWTAGDTINTAGGTQTASDVAAVARVLNQAGFTSVEAANLVFGGGTVANGWYDANSSTAFYVSDFANTSDDVTIVAVTDATGVGAFA